MRQTDSGAFLIVRLVILFVFLALGPIAGFAQTSAPAWPGRIEAVRSDWHAQTPPQAGWVDVTLPDDWTARWPGFDGVVWYRLTWNATEPLANMGLFIDYLNMAGTLRVNGAEIARDASLVEPLSRMWNTPRYFLLAPPLLRAGENVLLVRVSSMASLQPGLGTVRIGAPAAMRDAYERERQVRHDVQLIAFTITITLGLFFLLLWLFRRSEVAYGWYSAQQLAWLGVAWNQIATTPWPFASTDRFEAVNTALLLLYQACYFMFVLRFCTRRWPRREALMWVLTALGCAWVLIAAHTAIGGVRGLLTLLSVALGLISNSMLMWMAVLSGRNDQRFLAACSFIALATGVHDTLVFLSVLDSNIYYSAIGVQVNVIGVAVVLAWNFVNNLHRIEGFNLELQRSVADARAELATTLSRQHELELVHARLGERVSLAHDLHDGLGGMLIGNIAELEQAPEHISSRKMLEALRELRDDLRLIIDTASAQHYGEHSLAELLAPLRHRMARLFEARDIDTRWRVGNLEKVYLTTTQSLDLLRLLQEALTNVLKHSGAKRVDVELRHDDGTLRLEVGDDGRGMPTTGQVAGTGLRSMQARARRLGATLSIDSAPGATFVRLTMALPASATPRE